VDTKQKFKTNNKIHKNDLRTGLLLVKERHHQVVRVPFRWFDELQKIHKQQKIHEQAATCLYSVT
jgi:hypothetical protein